MLDAGQLFINEFMAKNDSTLQDEDGVYSDWIEIYNPGTLPVDLDGWFLTDSAGTLAKWEFPAVTIEPDDYLVVFASEKDRPATGTGPQGELHTNFALDSDGEYLALVQPDGQTVEHEYAPEFPEQKADVAYGMMQQGASFLVPESADVTHLVPTLDEEPLETVWKDIDFNDSSWAGYTRTTQLLITEASTSPSFVEIQNVSQSMVTTSGWVVAVNDAWLYNINAVHETLWELPSEIGSGVLQYRSDSAGSPNYWGDDIPWRTQGPGWVMILDNAGSVVDFVIWGYPDESIQQFQVHVNGYDVSIDDIWTGSKVPGLGSTSNSVQRTGGADHDSAVDWAFVEPKSMNQQNNGLSVPFLRELSTAVGFDTTSTDIDAVVQIDVEEQMHGQNASAWIRVPFEIQNPQLLDKLLLQMKYNDGFVAYINGIKVAEDNAPESLAWNSTATAARSVADSLVVVEFDVTDYLNLLRTGENVLAVHGLNVNETDSNFLIVPDLLQSGRRFFPEATPGETNSQGYPDPSGSVQIHTPGGTFVDPFSVVITTTIANAVIRYTLDETLPVESSPLYTGPITIDTTQQLRARTFLPGFSPGPVATETYVALGDTYVQDFTSDLPIVVLDDFSGGRPSTERPGYMAIFDTINGRSDMTNGLNVETRIGIKTRGSSSGDRDKASYAVEVWQQEINDDRDISVLGMPAESDWILYGPETFDRALIRNSFIYELSNQVGRYAVRTRFVEVFFNMGGGALQQDDYRGVYVLMEKIKRGPDRVDVTNLKPGDNDPPDVTGGYIIKVDRPDPGDGGFSAGGQNLKYVTPKEHDDITTEQKAYIKGYIDDFAAALNGASFADPDIGYAAYLDVDAAIDHNILNMLTKNPDAFWLSGYFSKDREGLLEYGPIWDFDRTMGCDSDDRAFDPTGWSTHQVDFFNYSWLNRLFQDINFQQRYTDRWQEWRQGAFSTANMDAIVDSMAAQLQEAAVRNFAKWTDVSPTGNAPFPDTFQGEIDHLKDWLQQRAEWVDSQFAPMPEINYVDVAAVTLTVPDGTTVYYTTDGYDPRNDGGGIYTGASLYTPGTEIVLDINTRLIARSYATSGFAGIPKSTSLPEWSGPTISALATDELPALAITEINYHPADPTDAGNFEFIELQNISDTETIDLTGVEVTSGISYAFADGTELTPGQYIVIASDLDDFELRYGTGINVVGPFDSGKLSNGGEQIELSGRFGEVLVQFTYDGGNAWPGRADGKGATLELIDPQSVPAHEFARAEYLNDPDNWHSSVAYHGTPGADPQPHQGVVINEVLSHTDFPTYDTIELHNVTDQPIDVGGWYLSDDWGWDDTFATGNYKRFAIPTGVPAETTILPGGYLVFDEYDFNPTPGAPAAEHFALNGAEGDDVWLMKADAVTGELTHFGDHVDFDAQANGESWGRWPNGGLEDGQGDLYPMTMPPTLGSENTSPRIGPVIVSELQYYPGIFHEDFNTGSADRFTEVSGNWVVGGGRYAATPATPGQDTIARIDLTDSLWADYAVETVANLGAADGNAVIIFDYQSSTNFKFAGAFGNVNQWQIGHRTAGGWVVDLMQSATIEAATNYDLTLRVEGTVAALLVEGAETVSFDFGQPLNDGLLGIGTADAASSFGMVAVEPVAGSDLEFVELYNPTGVAINLSQMLVNPHNAQLTYLADWHLDGGVDMAFDPGTTIGAGGTLVVLSFDPNQQANAARRDAFRAFYGIDASVPLTGGYSGKLGNGGEKIKLQRPDSPPDGEPDLVPRLLEDVVTYDDVAPWPSTADGNGHSLHRVAPATWGDTPANWSASEPSPGTVTFGTGVVARHIFYNESAWDWDLSVDTDGNGRFSPGEDGPNDADAIASDKTALLPGNTATFANYTSYSGGINGIMIDIVGVPDEVTPSAGDFEFHIGNDNEPGPWADAPTPTVTFERGAGVSGSDRVTLIWNAAEITNTWLEVTVLPTGLGLNDGDVFYIGNAIAEAGNSADAQVTVTDLLLARNNPRSLINPASITLPYDYNRDTLVDATDVLLARNNRTNFLDALDLIAPPAEPAAAEAATAEPVGEQLAWLYALEQPSDRDESSEEPAITAQAVDMLLE